MNINKQTNGFLFTKALTLLFIALKLTGYIAWSWWWVLSPMWISWGVAMGVSLIAAWVVASRKKC